MTIDIESPFYYKPLEQDEQEALKALSKGEATPYQQTLSLSIIVNNFSRAHDLTYIQGSFDGSAMLAGRAYVGQKILKYLNIPVGKLEKVSSDE